MRPETADGRAPGNNETMLAGGGETAPALAAEHCQGRGGKGEFGE